MRFIFYILFLTPNLASSQILLEESMIKISINNCDTVVLYSTSDCEKCYFYLPTNLKVSQKKHQTPEVSLVTWKNDSQSKTVGAIFHFLVEWGLTAESEAAVLASVRSEVDSLAVLIGPVSVKAIKDNKVIIGEDSLSEILKGRLNDTPIIPTTPGSKMAFSFRIAEDEIDDFLNYVKHPEKASTCLQATYEYEVKTQSGMQQTKTIVVSLPITEILKLVSI